MKYRRCYSRNRLGTIIAAGIILIFLVNIHRISQPGFSKVLPKPRPTVLPDLLPLSSSSPSPQDPISKSQPHGCAAYPETADVVIVVKTGATEAFQKVPMQLMTFLSCAPEQDVIVFSDMDQTIGLKRVYDSLDEVFPEAKKDNPDFELYKLQKEYRMQGEDIASLKDKGSDAWKLDKYKNVHTARKAWHLQPDKSWYFFIDADSYIFWPNFFQWLSRMNPDEKLYVGSRVDVGRPPFAHGGSGYLLSRAAMKVLVGKDEMAVAQRFDIEAVTGCCGDQELARTLQYKDVNVTNVRPLIQGNEARTVTFGPDEWCQPLITLHHMSAEDTNDIWQYELQRKEPLDILTIEDFYHNYIEPQIVAYREDWDNGSADEILEPPKEDPDRPNKNSWWKWNEPYKSFNACGKACKEDPKCFMFNHHGETCALGRSWKLGQKRLPSDGVSWKSGWNMERINQFIAENGPCKAPLWEAADP